MQGTLRNIWESLLPAPDIWIIKKNGSIEKVDQTVQSVVAHYLYNSAQLVVSLLALPFTSVVSLLENGALQHSSYRVAHHFPKAFGFANSGFQDGAIGTRYDPSSLRGHGCGDWDKILKKSPQIVTANGEKTGAITHGITLQEGEQIQDLFLNTIDHPQTFAKLLKSLGCSAYRISLERSVIEPNPSEFNEIALEKYRALFQALKDEGVAPWVTLHHFTNPQWFEDQGDFINEKNIDGFVSYAEKMVDSFPIVKNWMTFNEPGIRGLEAYIRGEHPPQKTDIPTAALLIRNILIAHTKAFSAMKAKREDLNVGITHQWLKFLPFSGNPIETTVSYFFTSLVHTPLFNFFKEGEMKIQIPFIANVQLRDENRGKIADFLGVQAYGFARLKIGFNNGTPHPGAADKVNNFFRFTAGSTCEEGGSMQYFGPPCKPEDLKDVLDEAFSIPKGRIPAIGITETGSDAKRMDFGKKDIKVDENAQAEAFQNIFAITQHYPLNCLFYWTLNRHCEWLSGGMPHLGISKLKNEEDGTISYKETPALREVQKQFHAMKQELQAVS